jgi:glycosyltransferase involved in cell wall biosynthesis
MATAQRQPSRHFIDLTTSLYRVGQPPMGVLRTEQEIARRLLSDPRLRTIPIAFQAGQMVVLEPDQVRAALDRENIGRMVQSGKSARIATTPRNPAHVGRVRQLLNYGKAGARALAVWLIGTAPINSRYDVRMTLLHARAAAKSIFLGRSGQEKIHTPDIPKQTGPSLSLVVHPREGDVLWTCGESGTGVPLRMIAEQKRVKHFQVAALGYDMIRINHPEWNAPDMAYDLFVAQTTDLLDAADVIYCISESTRRDLTEFAATVYRPNPQLELLRLGSDLPKDEDVRSIKSLDAMIPQLVGRRFALTVGTVEDRKNYRLLLKIWNNLNVDSAFDLDLVIVGQQGQESAISEIKASPLLGKRIFWLMNCPDSLLAQLYKRCEMVLCPSLMEGWGLPVAEGLAYGKRVVCSSCGGMPEAAMNLATILDPTDWRAWQQIIQTTVGAPCNRAVQDTFPTWDTTADSVCRGLLALVPARGEH